VEPSVLSRTRQPKVPAVTMKCPMLSRLPQGDFCHILIGDGLADLDDVRGNILKGRRNEIIPSEVVFVYFFSHIDP